MGALEATSHPGEKGRAGISGPASGIHICALPSSSRQPVGEASGLTAEKENSLCGSLPLICHQTASRLTKRLGRWKAHVVGQLGAARLSWEPGPSRLQLGSHPPPHCCPSGPWLKGRRGPHRAPRRCSPGPRCPQQEGLTWLGRPAPPATAAQDAAKLDFPKPHALTDAAPAQLPAVPPLLASPASLRSWPTTSCHLVPTSLARVPLCTHITPCAWGPAHHTPQLHWPCPPIPNHKRLESWACLSLHSSAQGWHPAATD